MDNSLDMDGSLNRSLTNSQIYDGEFFEIVGSEGDILVVRYDKFSLLPSLFFNAFIKNFVFFIYFSCNICTPDGNDGQLLRTSVKSNGNILKHIKVMWDKIVWPAKLSRNSVLNFILCWPAISPSNKFPQID